MKHLWGNPLDLPPYKGLIHPDLDIPDFRQALVDCGCSLHNSQIEILLDGRNKVWAVNLQGNKSKIKEIVIKEFKPKGLKKIKTIFLPSSPAKAWNGAVALFKAGIRTAIPIAYLERKKFGFTDRGCFVAERIEDAEEIRYLFRRLPPNEIKALLSDLASYLGNCYRAGILHKDLSDGNILVKKDKQGQHDFYLIDTNRIRARKKITDLRAAKNLIRLGIPKPYQRYFLEAIFRRTPVNPYEWFWYKWNKKSFSGYLHFKKKIGLKKLAEKLKLQ